MPKPFYTSKTFWFNLLALAVTLAGYFGFADFQPSADAVELGAVLLSVINLILRFATRQPITK